MVLKPLQIVSVLYDLAMIMAGEPRPHKLAKSMLQRVMLHTGCSGGLLLLNPTPVADGKRVTAFTYAAIGSPVLLELEGLSKEWPSEILTEEEVELVQKYLPSDSSFSYFLRHDLPDIGCIMLFSARPHENVIEQRSLLAPIMSKLASCMQHLLESERTSQNLKRSEGRIRGILEATPDWIWETSAQGIITFSNRRTLDILGYTADEMIGKTLFDFMPEQEVRHLKWVFRDILGTRREFHDVEITCLHKEGREVVLETSGVPILDSKGNVAGYRGLTRDITERKRIEESLIRARDEAKASDHAKSLFLSSISHEFRTPLNAILGHSQLIGMHEKLPDDIATSSAEIQMAGKTLLALINNILELSRVGSGNTELFIEEIPLDDVIQECVAQFADVAAWKKEPINCICACGECKALGDRSSLVFALNQLVSNAIKFNREGGAVTIKCKNTSNGRVRVNVQDEGAGLSVKEQELLFTPFSRLSADKGNIRGVGVGLTIAMQLAQAMSGTIGVESAPGKGSTFWIELPAVTDNELEPGTPLCEIPVESADNKGNIRVLVAEDYVANQVLLKVQLESLGCHPDIASNGEEALELWKSRSYDLILADINMPVLDGLGLAREIRRVEGNGDLHIPIIAITASDDAKMMDASDWGHVDDHLTKPIAIEDLRGILNRWMKNKPVGLPRVNVKLKDNAQEGTINLAHLNKVLGEKNGIHAYKLIETFINSADKGLSKISNSDDLGLVAMEMHKIKSAARTVGAFDFANLSDLIERQSKEGSKAGVATSIEDLSKELCKVKEAFLELEKGTGPEKPKIFSAEGINTVLIVDDDAVILQQLTTILSSLGAREIRSVSSGRDALNLLQEGDLEPELLICDLNMPGMDGVELIRQMGQASFKGGLILISGAEGKILNTVNKLADLQGLRVLGQLQKPVTSEQIERLLSTNKLEREAKPLSTRIQEISSKNIIDGMERDEFTIWLQPIVKLDNLKPVGVEALARWKHPKWGMVAPSIFIGAAEREGLIKEFSQMLVSKALMEGARLHGAGFPLTLAINLSGLWLDDLMLPDFILATTNAARLRTSDIILEVTETGVMKDMAKALEVLSRLRLKGFGLSIDDFGMGYSTFEQLDRIPFTELKLDRNFVSKGAHESGAHAILQSSMDIANKMALSTVAEGVETASELDMVRKMGCDRVQGFYIAKPMPYEKLIKWLKGQEGK